jgi:hypothetical protein
VLTALRSQVAQTQQIVGSTRQHVAVLADYTRTLGYPHEIKLAPAADGPNTTDGDDKNKPGKRGQYSRSFGKGGQRIELHGDKQRQWGSPTDPHEAWPNVPDKTGTFDGGNGSSEWHGPGRQGEAYAEQRSDGIAGKADVGAWIAKGQVGWSRDVLGRPLDANVSGGLGADANADGTLSTHGVSLGADAFAGGQVGGNVDYNLGPVDLSLGGAAQYGAGGTAHLDIGMQNGKFVLGCTLGLAAGPGAKLSPHIAIDPHAIVNGVTEATEWLDSLFN